jgi:hypothetical protein
MAVSQDWAKEARSLLKAELKRKEIGYKELAARLSDNGTPETEASITNKIARGTFSAAFLLQCLEAIGCRSVTLAFDR